jgi:hypothetical protein
MLWGDAKVKIVSDGKRAESDVNTFRCSRLAECQPARGMYDEGLMASLDPSV